MPSSDTSSTRSSSLRRHHDQLGMLQGLLDWYGNNSNAFLEAQWYMFGVMAMFGAAYTLKVNEHVRVDLVYGNVSERTRTWIDLIGGIFCLVPMCALLAYLTWPWFVEFLVQRRDFHQRRRARTLAGQADCAAWVLRWSCCRASPKSSSASPPSRLITCASTLTRSRCNDPIHFPQYGPADVRGARRRHDHGLPGSLLHRRRGLVLRPHRHRARPDQPDISRQPHLPDVFGDLQRSAAGDPVLHAHGCHPRTMRAWRRTCSKASASCSAACAAACPTP